jgi:hypothetical protein
MDLFRLLILKKIIFLKLNNYKFFKFFGFALHISYMVKFNVKIFLEKKLILNT